MPQAYAIDIETTGLDPRRDELISLAYWGTGDKKGICTTHEEMVKFFTENPEDTLYLFHNGKFDQQFILYHLNLIIPNYFDTRLASSLCIDRPTKSDLTTLAIHYHITPGPWKDQEIFMTEEGYAKRNTNPAYKLQWEQLLDYNLVDAKYTYLLAKRLWQMIVEAGHSKFFFEYLMPFSNELMLVEYHGVTIDKELLHDQWKKTQIKLDQLTEQLKQNHAEAIQQYTQTLLEEKLRVWKAGLKSPPTPEHIENFTNKFLKKFKFNFQSSTQVLWLLHNYYDIPCKNYKGKLSANKETLLNYANLYQVVDDVIQHRKLSALISYYKKWAESSKDSNKLHCQYNLDIARTGRLSSSNPNLQNIHTGEPRKLFIADPGYKLAVIDYAQIEPRIVAHISQDPKLLQAFHNDEDFYSVLIKGMLNLTETPNEIKEQFPDLRKLGKTAGLAILYGIGPNKLAGLLNKVSKEKFKYWDAHKLITAYFNNFQKLIELRERIRKFYYNHKYLVNMFRRPIFIKENELEHKGVNTVIQGSASDLCCIASLCNVNKYIKETQIDASLKLLVHDEVVYQIHEKDVDIFKKIAYKGMVDDFSLSIPLKIEMKVGDNWGIK